MATNVYTTAYTLDAIKRRGLLPGTGRITDDDLIGFVNDAMADYGVPLLMAAREGFLHATEDTALVDGQTSYPIPARAASERLVRVLLVNSEGQELPLDRVETARRESTSSGYELVDDSLTLWNPPSGYASLRFIYFCEPSRLVALTECAQVTAITSTTVTVDSAPATFTTSEPLDFIAGSPGFRCVARDVTPTAVVSSVLTFAAGDIPSTLAVGDYVALAGETPILQAPKTLRPLIEQRALCIALEALGDNRLKTALDALDRMEKRLVATLSPRVPGSPRVVINRFTPGSMRRNIPLQFR